MFQPSWIRITPCLTITKDNVDFKLVSLNVRGIRSSIKRKALFTWLTQQKADIIFLQETYSTKEVLEDMWNTQYNGKSFYSHGTDLCSLLSAKQHTFLQLLAENLMKTLKHDSLFKLLQSSGLFETLLVLAKSMSFLWFLQNETLFETFG